MLTVFGKKISFQKVFSIYRTVGKRIQITNNWKKRFHSKKYFQFTGQL